MKIVTVSTTAHLHHILLHRIYSLNKHPHKYTNTASTVQNAGHKRSEYKR
jgi:hypothetical protein